MKVFENVDESALPEPFLHRENLGTAGDMRRRINFQERYRQRGLDATIHTLQQIIKGSSIPKDAVIVVIEYLPTPAAEWLEAVRTINLRRLNGDDTDDINQHLMGICFAPDHQYQKFIKSTALGDVYDAYFQGNQSLPSIGKLTSRSVASSDLPPLPEPPVMRLLRVITTGRKPMIAAPSNVVQRFSSSPAHVEKWSKFVEGMQAKFGTPAESSAVQQSLNIGSEPVASIDFTIRPPQEVETVTDYASSDCVDLQELTSSLIAAVQLPTSKKVTVSLTCKDGVHDLWLHGSGLDPGSSIVLPALTPVVGFGLGDYQTDDKPNGLPFTINDDCAYLSLVFEDKSRRSGRVCQLMKDLDDQGKVAKLAFHALSPMVRPDDQSQIRNRYDITQKEKFHTCRRVWRSRLTSRFQVSSSVPLSLIRRTSRARCAESSSIAGWSQAPHLNM